MKAIFKKIISFISGLVVISIITFILTKFTSQDPAENYLRIRHLPITPAALENARTYLGLDKSWIEQYFSWFVKVLHLDFGTSYLLKESVVSLIASRFLSTFYLGVTSFILIIIVSIPIGVISGLKTNSFFDKCIRFLAFSSVSMPAFWLGYMLIFIFSVKLGLLPVSGKNEPLSIVLPSITLSFSLIGQYIALVRKAVSTQLESPHVENARMRGVKLRYLLPNHILRNALPSIATGLSLTFVYLMTGSLVVEEVFAWNGLGSLFVEAIRSIDTPLIQGCMMLFGLLFLLNNGMTQAVTHWIDPRVRKRGNRS